MAERPWMPMYWGDYLADTADLSTEEHGVYLLMIGMAWRRQDGALPDNMNMLKRWLQAHTGMHGHTFNALVPRILKRFWTLEPDGQWHQKRISKEVQTSLKRSSNASQSALKRWAKRNETKALDDAGAVHARAFYNHTESKKTQTPPSLSQKTSSLSIEASPKGGNGHPKPKATKRALSCIPDDWEPDVGFARSKGLSDSEINRQANKLIDWARANDKRYADWPAVWRNWVRSYLERSDGKGIH